MNSGRLHRYYVVEFGDDCELPLDADLDGVDRHHKHWVSFVINVIVRSLTEFADSQTIF